MEKIFTITYVILLVFIISDLASWGKSETFGEAMTNFGSKSDILSKVAEDKSSVNEIKRIPIKPESPEWLFRHSNVIGYVEIIEVDKKIKKNQSFENLEGIYSTYPRQGCKAKFLRILKGSNDLENTTVSLVKEYSRYFLTEKQKIVLYLKKKDVYHTIDQFGGEHRLASALCDINNIREDIQTGGIVVAVLNKEKYTDYKVHIIKGRHRSPINKGDEAWKKYLLKSAKFNEFDIVEVPLQGGRYTVLLELNGNIYCHSRLINGYYPYVIISENRFKPIYFDLKMIKLRK
jgi:hypothetical protein